MSECDFPIFHIINGRKCFVENLIVYLKKTYYYVQKDLHSRQNFLKFKTLTFLIVWGEGSGPVRPQCKYTPAKLPLHGKKFSLLTF